MQNRYSFIYRHPIITGIILAAVIIIPIRLLAPSSRSQIELEPFTKAFKNAYASDIEANGKVHDFDLVADETTLSLIDGVDFQGFAYNSKVPGPVWRIQKGDAIRINFQNDLDQETTVHFHGIRVPNSMDGVPGVTQSAVKPGESFIYEFTPKDAGTFWFHPHVRSSEQMEKGLYGVIIVEDPREPTYSQDELWVIDDWKLNKDGTLYERFNTAHDLSHDGRWGNLITVNGEKDLLQAVSPGERIRLRLVNVSNGRVYKLDFGDLDAKAIAVDGMLTKETFDPNDFDLSPGNRLDLDIIIPSDAAGKTFSILDRFILGRANVLGTFEVKGTAIETPKFDPPNNPNIPDWEGAEKAVPAKEFKLNTGPSMGMMGITWRMNGKAYPSYDPLTLEKGEFQVIEFNNLSARLHPMHLHGQFFKVLARNGKSVNEPYFQDTVLVNRREKVLVGLVPLDEGSWMNHCHILEHAEAGMMSVIEVE